MKIIQMKQYDIVNIFDGKGNEHIQFIHRVKISNRCNDALANSLA
jgi:hypothetical protein